MKQSEVICFHEVDFLLPVHRFRIDFSYTDKQRLSFIREFLLRIIHVTPMTPVDLAQFFDLTKRELTEALSDLVSSGDISHRDDGYVELTHQSKAYFDGLDSIPKVAQITDSNGHFSFELSRMNYMGSKRSQENWKFGLRLSIDNERKSRSEVLANKAFQNKFQEILDNGDIKGVQDGEDIRLNVYKVNTVNKVAEQPFRVKQRFCVSANGNLLERNAIEGIEDSAEVVELVTDAIEENRQSTNLLEIFRSMNELNDELSQSFITDTGIDIVGLHLQTLKSDSEGSKTIPFVGAIYTESNWLRVANILEKNTKKLAKQHIEGKPELLWITPENPFWGKSEKLFSCMKYIQDKSKAPSKQKKTLYHPKIYFPVENERDNWMRNNLSREYEGISGGNLFAYAGAFQKGNVEVMVHPEHFAMVCYHLAVPDVSPLPIPFGFVTEDKTIVHSLTTVASDFLEGNYDTNRKRDLGTLKSK